ncbi:D-alanyl-D-alanine endopeptidase [Aquabacterium lacunae]|uniref:D-alanyl-D-alanine endopeptidase n=2 Tax=Aquabacterium lacunae TaxID=2528630 RepID=A0A4Q9H141_9BURK|nr:D-alanyl-D-alanine endopeptidase [Aquabacterium lacunae]
MVSAFLAATAVSAEATTRKSSDDTRTSAKAGKSKAAARSARAPKAAKSSTKVSSKASGKASAKAAARAGSKAKASARAAGRLSAKAARSARQAKTALPANSGRAMADAPRARQGMVSAVASDVRVPMHPVRIESPAVAATRAQIASPAASAATGASFGQIYGLHHTPDPLELRSSVALVVDQDTNEVLLAKNSEAVLPIASLTKLMTAMVVVEARLNLDELITITQDDVDTEKNSSSRLSVGATLTRGEALHLALMASENRAAHALGRTFPTGLGAFVNLMNQKARQLGMVDSHYVEPTGLSSRNQASARDLATLVKAAYQQPLIRELSTSPEYSVQVGRRQVRFGNTNSLVKNPVWDIGLQKTGYIVEAGRCLVMQARMAGRKLIMVFLDSSGKYSRQADAERVRRWIETAAPRHSPSAAWHLDAPRS